MTNWDKIKVFVTHNWWWVVPAVVFVLFVLS